MLRQPKTVSVEEKYQWVEEVIKMLDMEDFSEAVVGQPGEGKCSAPLILSPSRVLFLLTGAGLNVEQRKRLTIGVELAAKPSLLLFLDEPTSGLDSTSAWSIVTLMRKVADSGQAVLSTIHQPSTMLFQEFDRLLFLAKGGKTVYFGDVGDQSKILLDNFHAAGARECAATENPAEYILDLVNNPQHDWPEVWNASYQKQAIQSELNSMNAMSSKEVTSEKVDSSPFALPLGSQIVHVTKRTMQQYFRTPKYVMGKLALATMSALFVGFTFFNPNSSQAGMQETLFAIFMVTTVFTPLVQQVSTFIALLHLEIKLTVQYRSCHNS